MGPFNNLPELLIGKLTQLYLVSSDWCWNYSCAVR